MNRKYIYKIVTKNAKEYVVRSEVENVVDFTAYCFESNKYNDFALYEDSIYTDKNRNEIKFNTVMISTNEISSIEYYIASI